MNFNIFNFLSSCKSRLYEPCFIFQYFSHSLKAHRLSRHKLVASCSNGLFKHKSFTGIGMLAVTYVKCVSEEVESVESFKSRSSTDAVKNELEKSCVQSVTVITNLIEEITVATFDSAVEYKNSLNELLASFEMFELLADNPNGLEESELAMIAARAIVVDRKKQFLELITLTESLSKVVSAVSELSFLIGSESSAMSLFRAFDSLRTMVNDEIKEVKELENKCLQVEKSMIEDTS